MLVEYAGESVRGAVEEDSRFDRQKRDAAEEELRVRPAQQQTAKRNHVCLSWLEILKGYSIFNHFRKIWAYG